MNSAPSAIDYNREQRILRVTWPDKVSFALSAEFLRVHSPSAEVRGHGVGQEVLQSGKRDITINDIEITGRYAIKISFDDGHDSGLFDWSYLRSLGENEQLLWQRYLDKLDAANAKREPLFIQTKQL